MDRVHMERTRACACSIASTLHWNPTHVSIFAYELLVDANLHSEAEALRIAAAKNGICCNVAQTEKEETT